MTKRKPITERMKIDALLNLSLTQPHPMRDDGADIGRYGILCAVCKLPILPESRIVWDHGHALALGGAHRFNNLFPIHDEAAGMFACNKRKTFGTKATSAGSDIHKIAKVKRLIRKREGTWKKSGRKLQGRGFSKQHRPMRKG